MTPWYVVQVRAGQESHAITLIERRAEEAERSEGGAQQSEGSGTPEQAATPLVKECFAPRYRTQQKVRGLWRSVERPLIPGYVIVVTDAPEKLIKVLRSIPMFTKLLRNEVKFIPLDRNEVAWFEAFTHEHDRTVPMSTAVKEGDTVTITDGPLQQHSAMITRIDRRRSMAYVQISFLGRTKEVPVGLKVVARRG